MKLLIKTIAIKCTILVFLPSIVTAADLSNYFVPPAIYSDFVTNGSTSMDLINKTREEITDFDAWRNWSSTHSTREFISPIEILKIANSLNAFDPSYYDILRNRPERIAINIYKGKKNKNLFTPSSFKEFMAALEEYYSFFHNTSNTFVEKADKDFVQKAIEANAGQGMILKDLAKFWIEDARGGQEKIDNFGNLSGESLRFSLLKQGLENRSNEPLFLASVLAFNDMEAQASPKATAMEALSSFDFKSLKIITQAYGKYFDADLREVGKHFAELKKYKQVETKVGDVAEQEILFRIKEYPIYLSIYRAGCGGDCSTGSSRYFPLMPYEHTYFIEVPSGKGFKAIGYITATEVSGGDTRILYIKDITGSNLNAKYIEMLIAAFVQTKDYYKVDMIGLPYSGFIEQNHFENQRQAISNMIRRYGNAAVRIRFLDANWRSYHQSGNRYDSPSSHSGTNPINITRLLDANPDVYIRLDVLRNPEHSFINPQTLVQFLIHEKLPESVKVSEDLRARLTRFREEFIKIKKSGRVYKNLGYWNDDLKKLASKYDINVFEGASAKNYLLLFPFLKDQESFMRLSSISLMVDLGNSNLVRTGSDEGKALMLEMYRYLENNAEDKIAFFDDVLKKFESNEQVKTWILGNAKFTEDRLRGNPEMALALGMNTILREHDYRSLVYMFIISKLGEIDSNKVIEEQQRRMADYEKLLSPFVSVFEANLGKADLVEDPFKKFPEREHFISYYLHTNPSNVQLNRSYNLYRIFYPKDQNMSLDRLDRILEISKMIGDNGGSSMQESFLRYYAKKHFVQGEENAQRFTEIVEKYVPSGKVEAINALVLTPDQLMDHLIKSPKNMNPKKLADLLPREKFEEYVKHQTVDTLVLLLNNEKFPDKLLELSLKAIEELAYRQEYEEIEFTEKHLKELIKSFYYDDNELIRLRAFGLLAGKDITDLGNNYIKRYNKAYQKLTEQHPDLAQEDTAKTGNRVSRVISKMCRAALGRGKK